MNIIYAFIFVILYFFALEFKQTTKQKSLQTAGF
jgi:hypothetical protein